MDVRDGAKQVGEPAPAGAAAEVLRTAGAFGYELRTQPVTLWLGLLGLAAVALAIGLPFSSGDLAQTAAIGEETVLEGDTSDAADELRDVYTAGGVAGLVTMLWAAVTTAGARRHGSLLSSALAMPRRVRLVGGLVLAAVAGGVLAGVATAAGAGLAVPLLVEQAGIPVDLPGGEVAGLLAATALHAVLSAALGAGLGLLLLDQTLAAVVVMAFGLIGPLLVPLAGDLAVLTPVGAAATLLSGEDELVAAGLFGAWAVVAVVAGAWALRSRDLI